MLRLLVKPTTRVAVVLGLFWSLGAPPAAASSGYPEVLQDELDLPCAPSCTICHRDTTGGIGTVVKPFGEAMIETGGLAPNDEDGIAPALATVDAEGIDSDEDGEPDVEELRSARDPNVPGEGELCAVQYGCGARVANQAPRGPADALALLLVGALLWVRARRRQ